MMPESIREDTLDFILNYTKGAPQEQLSAVDGLDSKAVQIFAAASVVIGLAGVAGGSLHGGKSVTCLIAIALAAYLAVSIATFKALRVRWYRQSLQADVLWSKYWSRQVLDIKHSLVEDISKAFDKNQRLIKEKADWVQAALILTTTEVLLVGVVILSRLA